MKPFAQNQFDDKHKSHDCAVSFIRIADK